MTPKSKLVSGVRVDATTGQPIQQSTENQKKNLLNLQTLSSDITPAKVPPIPPAVPTSPIDASLSSLPDQLTARAKVSEQKEASSFEDYIKASLEQDTPSQVRARVEQEQGILELDKQNEALKAEMTALDEQLRKQIEAIEKDGFGTAAGKAAGIAEATRVNRRQKADVAITQLAQQGQLDAAQRYANNFIQAEVEASQKKIDTLGLVYQRNKDLFTKDEQRAFETAQSDRQQKQEFEYAKLRADYEQKIKQSDPLYNLELAIKSKELARANTTSAPVLRNPVTGRLDPTSYFTSVIAQAGAKDNVGLQAIGGVLAATQALAESNPDGIFPGLGPIARFAPASEQAATSNRAAVKAINLKVQQWASGASLTEQQTAYVNSITPTDSDWGPELARKTNSLTNFMLTQARGTLASQGIQFETPAVDFFNKEGELTDYLDVVTESLDSPAMIYTGSGYKL